MSAAGDPHRRPRSLGPVVPETFERTQQQVAHILSAHRQLRSLRESEPEVLHDLLRASVVLVERSFVNATIDLAAVAAPAAIARGRTGMFVVDLIRSEAETITRLWLAARPPEELIELVRKRLRAEPPSSTADLELMFMKTVNMSVPWRRAGELLASERGEADGPPDDAGISDAELQRGIRAAIDDLHARATNIVGTGDVIERDRRAPIDVVVVRRGTAACRALLSALVESLGELLPPSPAKSQPTAADNRSRPSQLNRAVRAWARSQGLSVNTTGKLPQSLVDAYLAATEQK